ncbi:MAG: hypothetical protein Q4B85_06220 [Lachnospiraceae bacterium]|nr:hypothetical protein [Lachnospiraceae bacterium]
MKESRKNDRRPCRKGTCSGVLKRASITVEAALALPLFFLVVVSLMGLPTLYSSYAEKTVELQQEAENRALARSFWGERGDIPVRISGTVEKKLILLPFEAGTLKARSVACVRPWTGRASTQGAGETDATKGQLYYLSDYESVYHTSSCCSYLSLQIFTVETGKISREKNREGDRYLPCEYCAGKGETGSFVYVTEQGEHYHTVSDCTGLTRSIHLVDAAATEGLQQCTRCSRREDQQ